MPLPWSSRFPPSSSSRKRTRASPVSHFFSRGEKPKSRSFLASPTPWGIFSFSSCPKEEVSERKKVPTREAVMYQNRIGSLLPCRESLKTIEADIQHANTLAAAIQKVYGGAYIQMRLSYNSFAPMLYFLIRWLEITCVYNLPSYLGLLEVLVYKVYVDGKSSLSSYERKASLREFYGVIYPSLQQLQSVTKADEGKEEIHVTDIFSRLGGKDRWKVSNEEKVDREDECGICLETCTKMVLPNCNHSMCINCYRDWNTRSESCPFCRGSLKRVSSSDLWVLTGNADVVDTVTLLKENLRQFYLYINKLPLALPDTLFVAYYEYLF